MLFLVARSNSVLLTADGGTNFQSGDPGETVALLTCHNKNISYRCFGLDLNQVSFKIAAQLYGLHFGVRILLE